jgi:hypothetical protein
MKAPRTSHPIIARRMEKKEMLQDRRDRNVLLERKREISRETASIAQPVPLWLLICFKKLIEK